MFPIVKSTLQVRKVQLHGGVNMHTQRSSGARKRTTTLEKECTAPFKRKACDQGYAAEMPAYFMNFMAQMLNFQKDVCKTLEVVDKIDRMEAVISRKIDSLEERLNAKFQDLGSAVNGLCKDWLQLQEVSILKTERIPSRIANKPGIVIASVQTKEM